MKNELLNIIKDIITLLDQCNWLDKADWFREKYKILKKLNLGSSGFNQELRSIDAILTGMGSLSDLPLTPKKGVSLTKMQARKQQWDLVGELGDIIEKILNQ